MGKRKVVYEILRPLISSGLRLFHNEFYVFGYENLKGSHIPTIVVANHQNALLDPILCSTVFYEQLHWLTRSDVFKPGVISWILNKINMMPVYRERDNIEGIREKNELIFEKCYKRLNAGAWVSLFPEGTHRGKKSLIRPLKKGASRLIIGTFDNNPNLEHIRIIPVGLEYERLLTRDGNILIRIGEPILITKHDYTIANKAIWNNELTSEITSHISACMLDIQSENDSDYEATILIQELFVNSRENLSWGESNLIFQKLEKDNIFKERSLLNSAQNLIEISNKLELSESHWRARNALSLNRNMIQLILSPLSILGTILFWPISSFTENFVSKKVKDPLFKNSIRIAFKTFLGAPYAALIATLFSLLLPVNWLISLFSILMLGVLSVRAKIYLRMFISAIKLKRVLNQNSPQSQAYIIQRNNLISQINLLIHEKSK